MGSPVGRDEGRCRAQLPWANNRARLSSFHREPLVLRRSGVRSRLLEFARLVSRNFPRLVAFHNVFGIVCFFTTLPVL